ncbi:LicD family protein [Thiocapsa imhoffii]|nr:LicD family protein [Thiocapsa imhoffii]
MNEVVNTESQNPAFHDAILMMLVDLDQLCRANNLNYQLAAGTLLGAVREQRIIGWDKDADICMLRAEFERFMPAAESQLPEKYFLQHQGSESSMFSLVTKLRLRGTRRVFAGRRETSNTRSEGHKMHEGIAVDIFPFDAVQPNTAAGRLHMWLCANLKPLLILRSVGDAKLIMGANKPLWFRAIAWLCYQPLRLFPKRHIMASYRWLVTYYSRKQQPTGFVACLVSLPRKSSARLPRIRPLHSLQHTVLGKLGEHEFPLPHNYHEVLKNLYGNYVEPPPKSERKLGITVDFAATD